MVPFFWWSVPLAWSLRCFSGRSLRYFFFSSASDPYFLTALFPSLPRRRSFLRLFARQLRHSLIVRRRLLQQLLPRFHRGKVRRGATGPARLIVPG